MEKAGDIVKILLKTLFDKTTLKEGHEYHSFFSNWEKVIGYKYAQHSKPIEVREHFLYIEVDHPGWVQLIQLNEKGIIKKIKQFYPDLSVKFIKIKIKSEKNGKSGTNPENNGKQDKSDEDQSGSSNTDKSFDEIKSMYFNTLKRNDES